MSSDRILKSAIANVTLKGFADGHTLEEYVHECAHYQWAKGGDVVWYDLFVERTTSCVRGERFRARVKAHLRRGVVVSEEKSDDAFSAVRHAFDMLGLQLRGRHLQYRIRAIPADNYDDLDHSVQTYRCASCSSVDDLVVEDDWCVVFCKECLDHVSASDFPEYYCDLGGESD